MVYIDNFNIPFRGMIMCHMMADTHDELIEMATKIGLKISYIQDKGTYREHFDVSASLKSKALKLGAKEIGFREMARLIEAKNNKS